MKLYELYPKFESLSDEDRCKFVAQYRKQRSLDLTKTSKDKSKKEKESITAFSNEEKLMMKLLGLKAKDLRALKAMKLEQEVDIEPQSSADEDAVLFDENLELLDNYE